MSIVALLQPIKDCVGKTTLHQLNRIIAAMLAMMGRVTMLGISCWAGDEGSYRTIQRFYTTAIPFVSLHSFPDILQKQWISHIFVNDIFLNCPVCGAILFFLDLSMTFS